MAINSSKKRPSKTKRPVRPADDLEDLLADLFGPLDPGATAIDEETRRQRALALTANPDADDLRASLAAEAAARRDKISRLRSARMARDAQRAADQPTPHKTRP